MRRMATTGPPAPYTTQEVRRARADHTPASNRVHYNTDCEQTVTFGGCHSERSETTLLLHYCLGVPPESRIIGICEASCRSINITTRRSNGKNTAIFLPGLTLLKTKIYLVRN